MASRQSMMPSRNLTLTEELERLEQQITLTLQEIDHNFSKAHRVVTGSIIPIVEQYAKHSDAVWEGSKFWKQFFEASANVSLSGYEEAASEHEDTTELSDTSVSQHHEYGTPTSSSHLHDDDNDADADEADDTITTATTDDDLELPVDRTAQLDLGTPRAANPPAFDQDFSSPYESLRGDDTTVTQVPGPQPPSTPGARPRSQPKPPGPLLHRILDKSYRVQATPHTTAKKQQPAAAPAQQPQRRLLNPALASSPLSPELAAPQLRSELFSPVRHRTPRTPGVSMLKPNKTPLDSTRKNLFGTAPLGTTPGEATARGGWDSDEEDTTTDAFGMSPPKTMQFHVPASRLLATPAKEASRRIVADLLHDAALAGPGDDTLTEELGEPQLDTRYAMDDDILLFEDGEEDLTLRRPEDSPSIVRPQRVDDDDEF